MCDRHEKALKLAEQLPDLVKDFEEHLSALKLGVAAMNQRLATAKQHGLGPALMAPDLMATLLPRLRSIEALAQRAVTVIEELQQ